MKGFHGPMPLTVARRAVGDRKSTRLNSSHLGISYAVFCLKKKNILQLSSQLGVMSPDFCDIRDVAPPNALATRIHAGPGLATTARLTEPHKQIDWTIRVGT